MANQLICPQCGASNLIQLENGDYQCPYCKTIIPTSNKKPQKSAVGKVVEKEVSQTAENWEKGTKDRTIAAVLAIILGDFGVQFFYLGKIWTGVLCILFCWTSIPGLIGFIQGIVWLVKPRDYFDSKYNY